MWQYLLKRLVLFIPTIFLVSVATFFLSKLSPGDAVAESFDGAYSQLDYEIEARQRGLDKPTFYCALQSAAYPDTLYKILEPEKRKTFEYLIGLNGNAESVQVYYKSLINFNQAALAIKEPAAFKNAIERLSKDLFYARTQSDILKKQKEIAQVIAVNDNGPISFSFEKIQKATSQMKMAESLGRHYIPNFIWHGFDNQYHKWISNFLVGNFGVSEKTGQSVSSRVKDAVFWTFIMNVIAILLAFGIAIPLGVKAATKAGERFDKITTFILYGLYSLPSFWIATLLLLFFCSSEYGMNIFPSIGLGQPAGHSSFFALFWDRAYHLILPIFCITYPALAFIYRQMRGSMVQELKQNYVRTARSKGLPERLVVWRHAFKNALFPIITMIASVIPALITGSVVIEVVFNIPGMGKLMVDAIFEQNWPIVYTIMMMGAFFTTIGILIADLLYAWLDPRVRY